MPKYNKLIRDRIPEIIDYGHEFLPPLPFYLPSNAMFGTTQ